MADYDDDGCVDREDDDMDNDGVLNEVDLCPLGMNGWLSDRLKDQDGDGCEDSSEDDDDDGDGTVDAKQYMLMGEGAVYTWIRIGLALAAILLVSVLIRKKKGETDLFAAPANAKVSPFFEGDASDAPHGARQTQSSTHCSTCGGDGEWFDDHNWAWCNHCEAWVP